MARKNPKKGQLKILDEIKKQLILQAERWGRTDYYTPVRLEEMELGQCHKIISDLYMEKANIEYELETAGADTKAVAIKLEKLGLYIRKAQKVISKHERNLTKQLVKMIGDKAQTSKGLSYYQPKSLVSVFLNEN